MSSHNTTILRYDKDDTEHEIRIGVEYSCYKGCKGLRDSIGGVRNSGPLLTPDEPPSIEIESVIDLDSGKDIELTSGEEDSIYDELHDLYLDDYE